MDNSKKRIAYEIMKIITAGIIGGIVGAIIYSHIYI